jgi:hypothetical protein
MRSLAVTGLVAAAVGTCALAAGWSVEAAVLPRPPRGDRAAADAVVDLDHRRVAASTLHVGDEPAVRGRCTRGWFPARGTLLTLGNGARFFEAARTGAAADPLVRAELVLAGCPRVLASAIARLLEDGASVRTSRAWLGRPALAVRLGRGSTVLTLYLAPRAFLPLGVALDSPFVSGRSRIRYVHR